MKCVICKGSELEKKVVDEEIKFEKDIVLVSIEVIVCQSCGERYYDRKEMKKIEKVKAELKDQKLEVEVIGKVLRVNV